MRCATASEQLIPASATPGPIGGVPWWDWPEHDLPEALRQQPWQAVVLPRMPGLWLLGEVVAVSREVGPVLACCVHELLYVPVAARAPGCPLAERMPLAERLSCPFDARFPFGCPGRQWRLPHPQPVALTDFEALFDLWHQRRRLAA